MPSPTSPDTNLNHIRLLAEIVGDAVRTHATIGFAGAAGATDTRRIDPQKLQIALSEAISTLTNAALSPFVLSPYAQEPQSASERTQSDPQALDSASVRTQVRSGPGANANQDDNIMWSAAAIKAGIKPDDDRVPIPDILLPLANAANVHDWPYSDGSMPFSVPFHEDGTVNLEAHATARLCRQYLLAFMGLPQPFDFGPAPKPLSPPRRMPPLQPTNYNLDALCVKEMEICNPVPDPSAAAQQKDAFTNHPWFGSAFDGLQAEVSALSEVGQAPGRHPDRPKPIDVMTFEALRQRGAAFRGMYVAVCPIDGTRFEMPERRVGVAHASRLRTAEYIGERRRRTDDNNIGSYVYVCRRLRTSPDTGTRRRSTDR